MKIWGIDKKMKKYYGDVEVLLKYMEMDSNNYEFLQFLISC